MYENIRVRPYKCSLYYCSILSIIISIIFLFTDNTDVVSQTKHCDFLGVQVGWPKYRLVQKRLKLATDWAEPRLVVILMHD